jgi:D-alanyl-D-alanine carboxypeptidase
MMTKHAARQPASKLDMKVGETLSVEDAIRALAIKSANDVAAAVAEHMAGSERQFALLMTAKARSLGMSSTTFRNASGLPHRAQMSTARDMAKLARAMLHQYSHYYHYFSEEQFSLDGKVYKTHNKLLTNYEGTDGIKTGYIRASGFNLVASVKRGDKRLIGVIFGAKNSRQRNAHMVRLMEKGWSKIAPQLADNPPASPAKTIQAAYKAQSAKPRTTVHATNTNSGQTVWGVQVGAYKSKNPAYKIAVRAMDMASRYLADGDVQVEPLEKKNGHVLYRGRVTGITKTQAYRACKFFEKKNMDCMPLELASLN